VKPPPQPEMMRLAARRLQAKGYLGVKEINGIAARLRLPTSRVYGFISQFPELPVRPYRTRVRVCTGPACADAGAWAILEDLERRVPGDIEVLAEPGILHWHRSPAVCLETPGEGARLVEGLGPEDTGALVAALAQNELSSYTPLKDVSPPGVEVLPGHEPAPWSAAVAGGILPDTWGPDLIRWASEHPEEVMRRIGGNAAQRESGSRDRLSPKLLVCDAVGPEPENSVSFAVSLLHPRALVAGAAIAAAAYGARELMFYFPWNETEAVEALESAAAELLSGVGIRHSVLRGPVHVPCALDIGRAAVINGMMLWRAASLYGWQGTRGGDPSLAVLDAELAWRLPWLMGENTIRDEEWAGSRLVCLAGFDGVPRLLEVPPGTRLEDVLDGLGLETGRGGLEAVYAGGTTAAMVISREASGEVLEKAGEVVLLDPLTCMPRWALYLAWHAERGCCGGCFPGRTAPAAAARLIQGILRAEAGEAALEDLEALLANASGLALCPRLRETLNPILTCLREFRDEFEVHAKEGICKSGSCWPAVEAATYGG